MSFSLPRLVWIGLEAKLDQLRRRVAQQIGQASERLTRRPRKRVTRDHLDRPISGPNHRKSEQRLFDDLRIARMLRGGRAV